MKARNIFPNSEKEAKELADRLVQELKDTVGGDWEPRVWINGHWCYDAKLGSISVIERIRQTELIESEMTYSAYVNGSKGTTGGALAAWSVDENYGCETPKEAVENAMKNAQEYTTKLQETLNDNNKLIGNTSEN